MKYLVGIDLGTTGVKAIAINENGRVVAGSYREYRVDYPRNGWAEQNPEDWWGATCAVLSEVASASGVRRSNIAGIGLSGQMHGLVCLDAAGAVLRPAILWCDQRTTPQCRLIEKKLGGREKVIKLVSNPPLEGFTLPKLLWVKQHEPEIFKRTEKVLLPKDYIRWRLTGNLGQDMSDAAGTLMLDVPRRTWSDGMLKAVGIERRVLPALGEASHLAGEVTPQAAQATGLPSGIPVAFGGADNACAAVGNGVIEQGVVAVSIGTSGTVIAATTKPAYDKQGRVHTFNHAVPGLWYVMGVMQAAGLSLKWYRDTFGAMETAMARETGTDAYEYLTAGVATIPPGAEGLVWLPYLNGERTPHLDPDARGVLFGVTPRHRKAHVVRAMMEGVAFGLRDSIEIMSGMRIPMDDIRLTGGGARSALWRQIQADVFGRSVSVVEVEEGPSLGAAIIAGVATGVFSSFGAATGRLVKSGRKIEPNPKNAAVYEDKYELYKRLYAQLKPAFALGVKSV